MKKHGDRTAWTVTALALALTILLMNGKALGLSAGARSLGYEQRLFDNTKVHTIDIVMNDWEDLLANAADEEYYEANVVIDGEACKNVGVRAKGNTSLSTVASLGSQRYSLKVEFDHYDSGKSYYGLDKLSLNNLIQDATMLKDYLTYTLMNAFGVKSSLCSFAFLTVNGEDWGLYLAVEGVEEAFLQRNYGSEQGQLYKPDSMSFGGGRGMAKDFSMSGFDFTGGSAEGDPPSGSGEPPAMPSVKGASGGFDFADPPEGFDPSAALGAEGREAGSPPGMGGGIGSADVKLQYIDDDPESYPNIWENAKTGMTEADQRRLIQSLKKLSAGEDLSSVVDIQQVIRYFVVHNYVCNDDSYTGAMVHNYYLYEEEGRLAMLPWDYNLAFGTFGGGDAGSVVNTPIDAPVSGDASDRPMWSWIVENEEYAQLYHQYFAEFLSTVDIEDMITQAYQLIRSYVAKDPTAFYSYEEFELGAETLRQFCALRSESIAAQLANGETASPMNYADASAITLSDMGTMNGGMGGSLGKAAGRGEAQEESPSEGQAPPSGEEEASGSSEASGSNHSFGGNMQPPEGNFSDSGEEEASGSSEASGSGRSFGGNMQPPGGNFSGGEEASPSLLSGWLWMGDSVLILGLGLLVTRMYKA